MGSRMMSGNTAMHEELEEQLADYVGKESAILLNLVTKEWLLLLMLW